MRTFRSVLITVTSVAALLAITFGPAQAAVIQFEYSGTIQSILDSAGNPGGSFVAAGGPAVGDAFSGVLAFDPGDATPAGSPFPNVSSFDIASGTVFPTLIVDGTARDSRRRKAICPLAC